MLTEGKGELELGTRLPSLRPLNPTPTTPLQADLAGLMLTEGKGELELLAEVEGLEEDESPAVDHIISEPTMMGQHARNMFLNGDKQSGLASWKVRGAGPGGGARRGGGGDRSAVECGGMARPHSPAWSLPYST